MADVQSIDDLEEALDFLKRSAPTPRSVWDVLAQADRVQCIERAIQAKIEAAKIAAGRMT